MCVCVDETCLFISILHNKDSLVVESSNGFVLLCELLYSSSIENLTCKEV